MKLLGERWAKCDPKRKEAFEKEAKKLQEVYKKEMEKYKKGLNK